MVACSPATAVGPGVLGRGLGSRTVGGGGAGRDGSGVGLIEGVPVWLGFHIALKVFPFLSAGTGDSKAGPFLGAPNN